MQPFDQYTLGQTDSELELDNREDNQIVTQTMVRQARRRIDIASRDLDPAVYDQIDFIDNLKAMLLENRRARMRVIVWDAQAIARRGHQLVQLARDLSSFIEIRQAAREHDQYSEALFVADGCGFVHRLQWNRYEAAACFNGRRRAQALLNTFESMWSQGTPSVHLRRLSL